MSGPVERVINVQWQWQWMRSFRIGYQYEYYMNIERIQKIEKGSKPSFNDTDEPNFNFAKAYHTHLTLKSLHPPHTTLCTSLTPSTLFTLSSTSVRAFCDSIRDSSESHLHRHSLAMVLYWTLDTTESIMWRRVVYVS